MKLQTKILLVVFPLIVVPLLALGGIAYQRLQKTATDTLNAQIQTLLQQTEQQVHSFEQTAKANARLFAASQMLQAYLLADEERRYELHQNPLLNLFNSYQQAYPDYIEIRVIDPDGYESARFPPRIANLTEEENHNPEFQKWLAADDKIYLNYLRNPDNQEYVLQVANRLQFIDPTQQERGTQKVGTFRGFLVITARLSHLEQQVQHNKISQTGHLFLTDNQGVILIHPEPTQRDEILPEELRTLMQENAKIYWRSASGVYFQGTQLHSNLWMFAQVPEAEFIAASKGLGLMVASIIGVTILMTLFLLFILLKHLLIQPIQALVKATLALADGCLDNRLLIRSRDEMGELAHYFNAMAERLQTTQKQKDQAQAEAIANKEEAIENLKQADRLKDEFLANTSHELRTPLNGIIGISQSLLDGIGGKPSDIQAQNLRMIVKSGKRLANLVNDILDSFKMRTKKLQLQCRPVDIYAMSSLALELSQTLVTHKTVKLFNEIPKNLPPVYADENRLQQILLNLIGNAIKFTHNGHVTVRAAVNAQKQMTVQVHDSGIGIPQDKLGIIFRAFEQADGSTAREYGGTGLGLSVSKQLVELHGGVIQVESQVGEGSCFSFTLPLSDEALPAETVPDLPIISPEHLASETLAEIETEAVKEYALLNCDTSDEHGQCRVLIVDDEPINLHVLVNYLSVHNYLLTLAASGRETLDLLESGYTPDIIILDVMMPHMTGFEVTHILRNTWQLHELPIILLTAKNQAQDIVTGLEAGANDYLIKPVAKEELLARIRTHLAIKRLKASREAALETARLKSEFLANMSHEIRTPMNAIIGVSDLLSNTQLSLEQKEYVATIRTGSETLLSLINDILDFSKIEAGKLELETQPFQLRTCVEEALDLVNNSAAQKGLNLAYWIDWHTPVQIIGDITRLRQTLVNLLSNAVKFTQEGEVTVKVSAKLLDDKNSPPLYEFLFVVSDTGEGIPKARQDKLFQSFSQIDSSITRRYGGTGLGLAICKRLTELMNGKIWVNSVENMGSDFCFTICQPGIEQLEQAPAWLQAQCFAGKQVLVVEENVTNREIIIQFFNFWAINMHFVHSAELLPAKLQATRFDCVLVEMPVQEVQKKTLLECLKPLKETTQIPFILISPICRATRVSDLFSQCVSKPIRPNSLFERLEQQFKAEYTKTTQVETINLVSEDNVSTLRILLAEDNTVNQKVAILLLKRLGFNADIVSNGIEAVEAVKTQTYDVVFMDMQMPEMDGLSATRAIREYTGNAQQPWIIAMTANVMEEDKQACFRAGMNDYISKPIRPQKVSETIEWFNSKHPS